MDFAFSDEQQAIKDLAKQIFNDQVTEDSLREIEQSDSFFHEKAWKSLVDAQVLGVALPESAGGAGMGYLELALLLQQAGRHVAPLPLLDSVLLSAIPIAEFGGESVQGLVQDVLSGERLLTTGFFEPGGVSLGAPKTTATVDGDELVLSGVKTNMSLPNRASHVLLNANLDGDAIFVVVPTDADGVSIELQRQTNFETTGYVELENVRVPASNQLGRDVEAADVVRFVEDRLMFGQAALALGIAEKALFLTADYTSTREQFGKPIGTFQAVSQRAGDAYIDVSSIRLMVWKAAYELTEGLDAERSCRIAAYWAAEGGHRVVAAAQHLHGGMGFDCDYPLHRYFLMMKSLEFALGGARAQLENFGHQLAQTTNV
jgi:alkylation response protein AidB-like acyl-CoA dehydrogenase